MPRSRIFPNDYILKKHPDVTWRKWAQMVWNDIEWPTIIVLGLVSLIFGAVGFSQYKAGGTQGLPFWDALYLSLQLYSLQGDFSGGHPIPTLLEIARFLSPILAGYTLIQAFGVVFEKQLELFRLVRLSDHYIVCGLGQRGLLLVKDIRKSNQSVVVIEQDNSNPNLEICRELGVIAIIGDARESRTLVKAGVRQAKHLIAVCDEDGVNVEVAEQAGLLLRNNHSHSTTCSIQIEDPYLWTVLREREFTREGTSPLRVEMFNVNDMGARILLSETVQLSDGSQPPHLLIIGMGSLAEHLIVQAAREWCLLGATSDEKLRFTLVDANASSRLTNLKIRYPLLVKTCEFRLQEHSTNWPQLQEVIFPLNTERERPVSNVFICFDDSTFGLQMGFTLLQFVEDQDKELMIRMTEDSGLAAFLRETNSPQFRNLSAFGLYESTCKVQQLDDGTHEVLARIIHEDYVRRETQKGISSQHNPSAVTWRELPEELKESNRRQADHIGIKLGAVGCGLKPWREYGKEKFLFKPEQIFKMAKMEHERWCEEKSANGWKYGKIRDDTHKVHPDLVPWDSLTDEERAKDIEAVKLIPSLLAQAGFQIYSMLQRNES